MGIVAAVAGIVTGLTTVPIVDALARPETAGEANEAAPAGARQVFRDMARAIGVPLIAVAIVAVLGISLAQLLLGSA